MQENTRHPPSRRPPVAGIYLGRWFGIPISADLTWLFIFALVTFSFAGQFQHQYRNWSTSQYWLAALATSGLFFLSVLLHELGHSLVAIRLGIPVHSITLFIFGGVARITREPQRPRDELLIALAGPAVSFVIAGVAISASLALPSEHMVWQTFAAMLGWVGYINLALAVFNMVPGFPLDGGRVLRAIVWAWKKDFRLATRVAASAGSLVAYALIGYGIVTALLFGNLLGGVWLAFIGWFLLTAARSSVHHVTLQQTLGMLRVSDVAPEPCMVVPASWTVSQLAYGPVLREGRRCFLVEADGQLVGLVTLTDMKRLDQQQWPVVAIAQIMKPMEQVVTVSPSETLLQAMQRLDEAHVNQLPIMEAGHAFGMITREQLLRTLRTQMELGLMPSRGS